MTTAFDAATGDLRADDLSIVIGRSLTRSALLADDDASRFEPFVRGARPPYASYRCDVTFASEPFVVVLWFTDETLERISLVSRRPEFGTSWSDTSDAKENAHGEFLEKWLRDQLGPPNHSDGYRFAWGEVGVIFHPQDGFNRISVRYS